MVRLLYIFPHPDDESFGPAPAIARQRRQGHAVHLLTLTHGEATTQREKHGYSKDEMGAVRYREMQAVAEALDLTELVVLHWPDGALADVDVTGLEAVVRRHLDRIQPDVVVTYAVHGISGHPDHLVTHAVVKHVVCVLRGEGKPYPKRLALFTLQEPGRPGRPAHLKGSADEASDRERAEAALACYETYQDVVAAHDPLAQVAGGVPFELFGEAPRPRLTSLCEGLEENDPVARREPGA